MLKKTKGKIRNKIFVFFKSFIAGPIKGGTKPLPRYEVHFFAPKKKIKKTKVSEREVEGEAVGQNFDHFPNVILERSLRDRPKIT